MTEAVREADNCGTGDGGFQAGNTCGAGDGSGGQASATVKAWAAKRFKDPAKAQAFAEWFGDSKVVDEQGEPLRVFHGTSDDVEYFNLEHQNRKDTGWLGTGVYATTSADLASTYAQKLKPGDSAPNVIPLYAKLVSPYIAHPDDKMRLQLISHNKGKDAGRDASDQWTRELRAKGHDGVILKWTADIVGEKNAHTEVVVFDTAGVKSATGNRGTFKTDSDFLNEAFDSKSFQRRDSLSESSRPDPLKRAEQHAHTRDAMISATTRALASHVQREVKAALAAAAPWFECHDDQCWSPERIRGQQTAAQINAWRERLHAALSWAFVNATREARRQAWVNGARTVERADARVMEALREAFDPNQPRDEDGKWSGAGAAAHPDVPAMRAYWTKAHGLSVNSDDTVTMYHGTTAENAREIRARGFTRGSGKNVIEDIPDDAVWLTPDREYAAAYGGEVLTVRVPVWAFRKAVGHTQDYYTVGPLKPRGDQWVPTEEQPENHDVRLARKRYKLSEAGDNCGTGAGGFQAGNTCSAGGGGGGASPQVRAWAERKFKDAPEKAKAFAEWFGSSTIVADDGEPLTVYHGGAAGVEAFDPAKVGSVQRSDWGTGIYLTPSKSQADGYREEAVVAADAEDKRLWKAYEDTASRLGTTPMNAAIDLGFGSAKYDELRSYHDRWAQHREQLRGDATKGAVYSVHLKMENPLRYQYEGLTDPHLAERARSEGHDGVIVYARGGYGKSEAIEELIVFHPEQIKSATGNRGTFDPKSRKLNEAASPEPSTVARAVILEPDATLWLYDADGERGPMLPGGHVEDGESAEQAAVRECREETGFDVEIVRWLIDVSDEHATRRYYLARRVGGEATTQDADSGAAVRMRRVTVDGARALLISPFDVAAVMQAAAA